MQSAIMVVILENENVDEKIRRRAKNRESRRRQRQSGTAENRAAGLTARCCDVGLTLQRIRGFLK